MYPAAFQSKADRDDSFQGKNPGSFCWAIMEKLDLEYDCL